MGQGFKQPRHMVILFRGILAGLMFAGLLWYGDAHETTISELTKVIASTSIFLVAAAEILDKIAGHEDYAKLYGWAQGKIGRGGSFGAVFAVIIISAMIFAASLYFIAGSITFSLNSYSPAILLWAGLVATYIALPETGDNELLLWIWLGATIATRGQYLHTAFAIPALTKLIQVVLRL